jgi:hypothetical protein
VDFTFADGYGTAIGVAAEDAALEASRSRFPFRI